MPQLTPPAPLTSPAPSVTGTAEAVLRLLLPHRRTLDPAPVPLAAFAPQLARITRQVVRGHPLVMALPGFPCKSPNPAKVLGHLPDQGERLSLRFLDALCRRIGEVHAPGARIVVCSDGHVFGDLVRVPDAHIDAYGGALRAIIAEEDLVHLSVFDLRDALGGMSPDEARATVHERHAPTVEELRAEVRREQHTLGLYRGITRFLVDDTADFTGTRSALQRECRARAYGVIQRSRAWGALIAEHHPEALRLSIHPQPAGAQKFGIRLLDAADAWTTPWHSTALHHRDGRWELTPRSRAEAVGRLVHRDGRPSHFAVPA